MDEGVGAVEMMKNGVDHAIRVKSYNPLLWMVATMF